MKKIMCLFVCGLLTAGALTGCGSSADTTTDYGNTTTDAAADASAATEKTDSAADAAGDFDASSDISVVSREDGSGTRGAFIELFGVEEKDGIAIIVNKNNPTEDLTKNQVNSIFRGEVTTWDEVK